MLQSEAERDSREPCLARVGNESDTEEVADIQHETGRHRAVNLPHQAVESIGGTEMVIRRRTLIATGLASALAVVYLFGGITLGGALAQSPAPPSAQELTTLVENGEQHDPAYRGSIQVPADSADRGEQEEATSLQQLATLTAEEAKQAALREFPGATVGTVELDNENGSVVYSVHLTDSAGVEHDVKVDAGNGNVLAVERGDAADHAEAGDTVAED